MKHNRLTILTASVLMGIAGMAQAGTAGLSGVYTGGQSEDHFQQTQCGTYNPGGIPAGCPFGYTYDPALGGLEFQAWAHTDGDWMNPPVKMGWLFNKNGLWNWDFDNSGSMQIDQDLDGTLDTTINHDGMLTLGAGHHYDANTIAGIDYPVDGFQLTIGVPWTANNRTSGIPIVDNGDGSYTGYVEFTVFNTAFGPAIPHAWLELTWEITDDGMGNLTMVTMDADGNGYPGTVPGDPANGDFAGFPFPFEPRWDGAASVVPVPAAVWLFGSGLLGLVGIARRKKS